MNTFPEFQLDLKDFNNQGCASVYEGIVNGQRRVQLRLFDSGLGEEVVIDLEYSKGNKHLVRFFESAYNAFYPRDCVEAAEELEELKFEMQGLMK